ncbi:hypothetical protein [Alteribacter aurantiacus]|uniref:hypothetical protein n=1 Tax=Alteribacter aurantiacus TaxID=254410 RepID=UPI00041BF500|nr:hypothetical protein [Alteribacter aurantiacus]
MKWIIFSMLVLVVAGVVYIGFIQANEESIEELEQVEEEVETQVEDDEGIQDEPSSTPIEGFEEYIGHGMVFPDETEPENDELSAFIRNYHSEYNRLVGHDNINQLNWSRTRDVNNNILNEIKNIKESVQTDRMKHDLRRIKAGIYAKREIRETDVVRDLHRLFHDLDIHYNNYSESTFGATLYGGTGRGVERINEKLLSVSDEIEEYLY